MESNRGRGKVVKETYGLDVHVAVPSQTDSFCTFSLLQSAEVELEVLVVEVDRGDSRVLRLKLLLGIEDENGKVTKDGKLEGDEIIWVDLRGEVSRMWKEGGWYSPSTSSSA